MMLIPLKYQLAATATNVGSRNNHTYLMGQALDSNHSHDTEARREDASRRGTEIITCSMSKVVLPFIGRRNTPMREETELDK